MRPSIDQENLAELTGLRFRGRARFSQKSRVGRLVWGGGEQSGKHESGLLVLSTAIQCNAQAGLQTGTRWIFANTVFVNSCRLFEGPMLQQLKAERAQIGFAWLQLRGVLKASQGAVKLRERLLDIAT